MLLARERGWSVLSSDAGELRAIDPTLHVEEIFDWMMILRSPDELQRDTEQRIALDRLTQLIHALKPFDHQLMLLYLEDWIRP